MLSHRLLACAATLACATLPLVVPAAQAYTLTNTPRVTTSSSAALPASSDTPELNAATAAQAHHEAFASSSLTRTRSNTATSSGSTITTFEALVLIAIITIIFLPASIIYVIFYRQARKDVRDMPNYTSVNGPQYGVTGYPQGTVPPKQSRYTGFNPLWSRNTSYNSGPAMPGTPGAHGYGTPTGQGPVYGTQPSQGPRTGMAASRPPTDTELRVPRGPPMARKAVSRDMEQRPPRRTRTHRSARLPGKTIPATSHRMGVPRSEALRGTPIDTPSIIPRERPGPRPRRPGWPRTRRRYPALSNPPSPRRGPRS